MHCEEVLNVNLHARQKQIEEEFKESFNLPIIYPIDGFGLRFKVRGIRS